MQDGGDISCGPGSGEPEKSAYTLFRRQGSFLNRGAYSLLRDGEGNIPYRGEEVNNEGVRGEGFPTAENIPV